MPDIDTEQKAADESMKKLLRRKIEGFNPYRQSRLLTTKANIAYLCGHQNIEVLNGTIQPLRQQYCTQVTWNKVLPAVGNDIAVATKTAPKWEVIPDGTDEDDKATAKAGNKILQYLMRINRFHEQRKSIVLWYDIDGIGWRKIYWNPYHKVTGRDETGEPVFQGEVVTEHIPNTELIYDWRQKKIDKLEWFIHPKTITMGEVKKKWGDVVASKIPKSALRDKISDKDSFEVEVMGEFQQLSETITPKTPDPKEGELIENDKLVNCYEFWHIITKSMPQGSFAVGLGDPKKLTIVENKPYPIEQYPHSELPIIGYDPLSLDGITIGATARISQARPLQRYFNQFLSLIADNLDALGNSVIITTRGANVDFKKLDNFPGNIIEVDSPYASGAIDRQPGVPIPTAVFAFIDRLAEGIDEIFAFHEPSKGIMPEGGPRSAIGLQVLQEADNTQLSPIVKSLDLSDQRAAYQMLSLALANYNERLISIVGKDNQWVLEKVNGEELNGKVNVIVRTGSSLPMNKTLEEQKITFAWQSGLLGDPMSPEVRLPVLKAMDLGGFEQILQSNAKHINFAQKEFINAEKLALQAPPLPPGSVSIEEGQLVFADAQAQAIVSQFLYVPSINEFDDHYTHSQEHTNWLLDKFYEYMGSGNPILQALAWAMRLHNNEHQQRIALQQMQMMAMQNPKLLEAQGGSEQKK